MLNIFNGPPVSFNRDGGPSLAHSGVYANLTGVSEGDEAPTIQIKSTGRPLYVVAINAMDNSYNDIQIEIASTSFIASDATKSETAITIASSAQYGSVATNSTASKGGGAAGASTAPYYSTDLQSPHHDLLMPPIFVGPNKYVSVKRDVGVSAMELSVFWVELVQA